MHRKGFARVPFEVGVVGLVEAAVTPASYTNEGGITLKIRPTLAAWPVLQLTLNQQSHV